MVTPELTEFVKNQLAAGVNADSIRATLATQGWTAEDIAQALPVQETPVVFPDPAGVGSRAVVPIVLGVLAVLLVAGGIVLYMKAKEAPQVTATTHTATPVVTTSPTSTASPTATATPSDGLTSYTASECDQSIRYDAKLWTVYHRSGPNSAGFYSYYFYPIATASQGGNAPMAILCGTGADFSALGGSAEQTKEIQSKYSKAITIDGKDALENPDSTDAMLFTGGRYYHYWKLASAFKDATPTDLANIDKLFNDLITSAKFLK